MPLLDDDTRAAVAQRLSSLAGPVKLRYFRADGENESIAEELSTLLHEVAELSPAITLEEHDYKPDSELVARYAIERAPAIVVEGARDHGLRYYGAPSGYEFSTFLDVMADVSRDQVDLPDNLRAALATLTRPVHIQVFSTPT